MNNNWNNKQERIHSWGGSYISEKYGIKRFLNQKKVAKMPIKKGDTVFIMVPHDYAEITGLRNSVFCISKQSENDKMDVMMAKFVANDELGGVWLRPATGGGEKIEMMIPYDVIMFMGISSTIEDEKKFGFKIPDNIIEIA